MKQYFIKGFAVAGIALLTVPAAFAQKEKGKEEKEMQQIIITRKGDLNDKTVIEIKGDKVTVNGKDAKDNNEVSVNVHKLKDYNALVRGYAPGARAKTWNFNMDDEAISLFHEDENRAMLGVVTDEDDKGAEITSVSKESAAEKAGLKRGDIIIRIGDRKIEDTDDVSEAIRAHKPGDKVAITVLRDGKEQRITAELGKWKGVPMPPMTFNHESFPRIEALPGGGTAFYMGNRPKLGLSIQDTEEAKGVKVTGVEDESNAAKAGVKEGDVITRVNGEEVNSTDQVVRHVRTNRDNAPIRLEVLRNGKTQNLEVRIPRKLKEADL